MVNVEPGFYILQFQARPDGTKEYGRVIFPQGYDRYEHGGPRPLQTREEAMSARLKILQEAPSLYEQQEGLPYRLVLEIYELVRVDVDNSLRPPTV